ncbi:hypothetical protein DAI22_03g363900 [Oryza sativa Japonica Group]|nr:hypothetical protein DAI22_03g363900 [Oryza sativa Japonica Group]
MSSTSKYSSHCRRGSHLILAVDFRLVIEDFIIRILLADSIIYIIAFNVT